jgi:RNA polymerase sigma-70 factor (ECF subfamily)
VQAARQGITTRRTTMNFPPTRWSVVYDAKDPGSTTALEALAELCEIYRPAVYAFLCRRYSPPDADDLTQGFFEHLLEKEFLKKVDRTKGKFRTFLCRCLKHFLINQSRRPRVDEVAVDPDTIDMADENTPDKAFDETWALTLVQRVFSQLKDDCERKGKGTIYARLRAHLTGDIGALPYAELEKEFQMKSATLRKAVLDLRHHFGELLREEVADTVALRTEIDAELREIMAAWMRLGAPN